MDDWLAPPAGAFATGLALVGIMLAALGHAAERALAGANRVRLRGSFADEEHPERPLWRLLEQPERAWLAAFVLGRVGLTLAAVGGALLAGGWLGAAGALGLVTLLGALLPAAWASRDETHALMRLATPLDLCSRVLSPLLTALRTLVHSVGGSLEPERAWREEELRAFAHVDEDEGPIEEDAIEMIAGIFELGDTRVREVMVPRIDMVTVKFDAPVTQMVDTILRCGHSRIPVIRDTVDDVVGVLYAKDLLKAYRDRDFHPNVAALLRQAQFVPESKPVMELLAELQASRVHLMIVVDEFGGTAGLVTIEDLLEEIVGEIQDEYDTEEAEIESIGETEGIFRAAIRIEDVNRLLDLRLPTDRDETLAGLVFSQLGRLPQVGDKVMFDDATVEVLGVGGRRTRRVRVIRRGEPEEGTS